MTASRLRDLTQLSTIEIVNGPNITAKIFDLFKNWKALAPVASATNGGHR